MSTTTPTDACIDEVVRVFDAVFSPVAVWGTALEDLVSTRDGRIVRDTVDAFVEQLVTPELARHDGMVIGAGFVASPGFLVDAPWHLSWWLGHANTFGLGSASGRLRRLAAVEDPDSEDFRDYTTLEWWRVPTRTGARHITGPYVDYLCTDDYTLTLTQPVRWRDAVVGVVGADLYVTEAERALLPALRLTGRRSTLVNGSGRVVTTTEAHLATGSLLRTPGLAEVLREPRTTPSATLDDGARVIRCGATSLWLVVEA